MKNKKNALIFDWIIYIKVVEKKSFSAAARELMVSVASVSKVVARLEDIFSARLISRNAHRFEITGYGQIAYEKALSMCETYHDLLNGLDNKGEIKGEIRLSAPGVLCDSVICYWVMEYTDRHPGVSVYLLSREAGSFSADSPEFDDLVVKSGYLESPDLIQKKLNPVPFGIYASPKYLKIHGLPCIPEELCGHRMLRLIHPSLRNPVEFYAGRAVKKVALASSEEFYSNSIQSLLNMTLKDRGICVAVPKWVVKSQQDTHQLSLVLPDWELPSLPAYMVWRYRKHYSPLFSDFSRFIEMKWNNLFSSHTD